MSVRKTENTESEVKKRSTGASKKTDAVKAPDKKNASSAKKTTPKPAVAKEKPASAAVKKSDEPAKAASKAGSEKKKPQARRNKPDPDQATAASGKSTARKSVSGKRKSAAEPDSRGGEASSKTPQVMKLVEQKNDMVNPTIMAGKSSIPRKLRGLEPLSRIMKRDAAEIFAMDGEAETYNLTALVIEDNAGEILRRFNACDCEICIEKLSQLTAEVVPARFAKLTKKAVEYNVSEVQELKEPLKKTVTSRMIRLVMKNKKRSYHDV